MRERERDSVRSIIRKMRAHQERRAGGSRNSRGTPELIGHTAERGPFLN